MSYKPPYTIDSAMVASVARITRLIGRLEGLQLLAGNLRLRRENQIRSLHSSLAIEGNQLTRKQVTDILDGKRVIGSQKDILEVKNASVVYSRLQELDANREDQLLVAHGQLMKGLISDAGKYRSSGVGVVDGDRVIHVAPPAKRVPVLMSQLFDYLKNDPEDVLIKSCVFHYEFEFIHPFSDGNGRMGRLWQTVILKRVYPEFIALPLEGIIRDRQQLYYDALLASQSVGSSNPFISFALDSIEATLEEQLGQAGNITMDVTARLQAYRRDVGEKWFSRSSYGQFHKRISPATQTRDLRFGIDEGVLERRGEMRTVQYRFLPDKSRGLNN